MNLVEIFADGEEQGFDQPCKFGNLVEGHAVYCHNEEWKGAPRKCRRSWHTGGEVKDGDCEGFKLNPMLEEEAKEGGKKNPNEVYFLDNIYGEEEKE